MEKVNIVMLGTTNAGKTCYMVGMYSVFVGGYQGFTLSTDEDLDLDFSDWWMKIIEGGTDRWPPATADEPKEYPFSFNYGFRPLLQFKWLDYRGGAMRDKSSSQDLQKLKAHLFNSTVIMLCVSGENLTSQADVAMVRAKAGINRMNLLMTGLLNDRTSRGLPPPPVAIVITKSDLCQSLSRSQIEDRIRSLFHPLFTPDGGWTVVVCPVSLGKALAGNEENGEIQPANLHLPVAFATYCRLQEDKRRFSRDADEAYNRAARLGGNAISRWWNSAEIESAHEAGRQAQLDLHAIQRDMALMIKELSSLPLYYNGEAANFDV